MLTRFSSLRHGFELLEGNIHDQDVPPSGELMMPRPQRIPLISIFPLDPRSTWGTLTKFQTLISHYIHHILLSPRPHSLMDASNGPPRLSPLDTKII